MTRRRLLLFGLIAGLLALGAGVLAPWPRSAITRENAAKVYAGMTLAEVEAILGGPARDDVGESILEPDFDADPTESSRLSQALEDRTFGRGCIAPAPRMWRSGEVVFLAQFDDGKVTACAAFPVRCHYESPFDRMRRWLRL